ncbi:hypothetical protein ES703_105626 [subsurface metagenome]
MNIQIDPQFVQLLYCQSVPNSIGELASVESPGSICAVPASHHYGGIIAEAVAYIGWFYPFVLRIVGLLICQVLSGSLSQFGVETLEDMVGLLADFTLAVVVSQGVPAPYPTPVSAPSSYIEAVARPGQEHRDYFSCLAEFHELLVVDNVIAHLLCPHPLLEFSGS